MTEKTETVEFAHGIYVKHHDAFMSEVWKDYKFLYRFKGETAWSDAERYANDMCLTLTYNTSPR
jgi:hypothetical protein